MRKRGALIILYARIKKRFGDFLLDIEFENNKGTLALLGASGCGKSMTLKCIAGIETPDEGQIVLNNRTLFDSTKKINLPSRHRKVGLLFQNYALFPNMTLEKNISIGVSKNHPHKADIVKEKIKTFSLEGLENNYPHQLSGGQQQRVALARMLVNQPEILMLDEPFSALDEHLRWQMEQELIEILRKHNDNSSLYVSHNKDEVYRICDRIAVLNNGKIEEISQKENLFNNPKTLNTAMLIGCRNISRIKKISKNKIYAMNWGLELVCNNVVEDNMKYIGIHTQNINLCLNNESMNTFKLNIIDIIENLHSYTLALSNTAESKGYSKPLIYMKIFEDDFYKNNLSIGKSIYVNFDVEKLLLLH